MEIKRLPIMTELDDTMRFVDNHVNTKHIKYYILESSTRDYYELVDKINLDHTEVIVDLDYITLHGKIIRIQLCPERVNSCLYAHYDNDLIGGKILIDTLYID